MDNNKISLYKELYYWICFYNKKIKTSSFFSPLEKLPFGMFPLGVEYASFLLFSILITYTFLCFYLLIYAIFRVIGWDVLVVIWHNIDAIGLLVIVMVPFLGIHMLDFFLFFKKVIK